MSFFHSWGFWVLVGFFFGAYFGLLIGCLLSANRISKLREEIWKMRRGHNV